MDDFSEFVIKARKKSDMTLHEFAQEIGTSWITVWRWENEKNKPKPDAIEYWIKQIRKV
jgi:DNA-binding transcriptional regulator YiaG